VKTRSNSGSKSNDLKLNSTTGMDFILLQHLHQCHKLIWGHPDFLGRRQGARKRVDSSDYDDFTVFVEAPNVWVDEELEKHMTIRDNSKVLLAARSGCFFSPPTTLSCRFLEKIGILNS
jgi:hypothetical protein